MKLFIGIICVVIFMIILHIVNYSSFLILLSIIWYGVSILFLYSAIRFSLKYKFIQYKVHLFFDAIKSKSNNDISPLSSLSMSLAAKIGVGSLSGVALALYFGGVGSIIVVVVIAARHERKQRE